MLCLYVCYCFGIPTGSAYDLHHLGKIRMNLGFTKQQYGPHVFFCVLFLLMMGKSRRYGMSPHYSIMTSSNGNIFCVTGSLCVLVCLGVCVRVCVCVCGGGGVYWLRPVAAELWCFLWSPPRCSEKPRCCWFHTLSRSLWRHCNEAIYFWLRSALPVAVPAQQSCINSPPVGEAHVCTCFDKKSLSF